MHVGKGLLKQGENLKAMKEKTDKCAYRHISNINKIKGQILNRKTFGDM